MNQLDLALFFNLIRTCCTVGTFILGIVAFRFFLKNKLVEKQLDIVVDLIERVSATKFSVVYKPTPERSAEMRRRGSTGAVTLFRTSLFGIASIKEQDKEDKSLFISENSYNTLIALTVSYAGNPLLPASISQTLAQLKPIKSERGRKLQATQSGSYVYNLHEIPSYSVICLQNSEEEHPTEGIKSGFSSSYIDFVDTCTIFTESIESWLSKYGIKDINTI